MMSVNYYIAWDDMSKIICETEYLSLSIILILLVVIGLRKHEGSRSISFSDFVYQGPKKWLAIDYDFSQAIKAVSCIMILMGHYRSFVLPEEIRYSFFTNYIGMSSANIALFFFMFFSGYGLSLKINSCKNLSQVWWNRMKKIYLPLLFTCCVMMVIYSLVPNPFSQDYADSFHLSRVFHAVHEYDINNTETIIRGLFGWGDWYVTCILMFYTIFYLSLYISIKVKKNHTIVLGCMMMIYFIWAYFYYGAPEAHYFRYPWVFMLGHVIARWDENPKKISFGVMSVFALTEIPCGLYYHIFSLVSLLFLVLVAFINTRYSFKGKILLFVGSISYFYYLCHFRIAGLVLPYLGIRSLLLWAFVTIPIAWGIKTTYDKIMSNVKL